MGLNKTNYENKFIDIFQFVFEIGENDILLSLEEKLNDLEAIITEFEKEIIDNITTQPIDIIETYFKRIERLISEKRDFVFDLIQDEYSEPYKFEEAIISVCFIKKSKRIEYYDSPEQFNTLLKLNKEYLESFLWEFEYRLKVFAQYFFRDIISDLPKEFQDKVYSSIKKPLEKKKTGRPKAIYKPFDSYITPNPAYIEPPQIAELLINTYINSKADVLKTMIEALIKLNILKEGRYTKDYILMFEKDFNYKQSVQNYNKSITSNIDEMKIKIQKMITK